jgi:hypothetical protein
MALVDVLLAVVGSMMTPITDEEVFLHESHWHPLPASSGSYILPAGESKTFLSTDIVTGSIVAMPWLDGFDPLKDQATTVTVANTTTESRTILYKFLDCAGTDLFIGSKQTVLRRDRSLWKYTLKQSTGSD